MPSDDLDLSVGKQVVIYHIATKETFQFKILQTALYKGQVIVYGLGLTHGIRVYAGTRVVPARPGCWVYIGNEHPARVVDLVAKLNGQPLVILQNVQVGTINQGQSSAHTEARAHPILQAGRLPGIAGYQDGAGQDGMIRKAMRLIDIYWDWREKNHYGPLPAWVLIAAPNLK